MTTTDYTDRIAVAQEQSERGYAPVDRDDAIVAIRAALKRRSGKTWSVTGGKGTGWGWISIQSPPKRRTGVHVKNPDYDRAQGLGRDNPEWVLVDAGEPQRFGLMTPADVHELGELLGLENVHEQGVSIPASTGHRIEYVARAEGRNPSSYGVQYWD